MFRDRRGQGQTPAERSEATQSITGSSNDMSTSIGGTTGGDAEKAGRKADSIQFIENQRRKASIYS